MSFGDMILNDVLFKYLFVLYSSVQDLIKIWLKINQQ
jgi:hypothetical protein